MILLENLGRLLVNQSGVVKETFQKARDDLDARQKKHESNNSYNSAMHC